MIDHARMDSSHKASLVPADPPGRRSCHAVLSRQGRSAAGTLKIDGIVPRESQRVTDDAIQG